MKLFSRDYHGFEDVLDMQNHIDWWIESNLSGEFQGTLKVTIEYVEPTQGEQDAD